MGMRNYFYLESAGGADGDDSARHGQKEMYDINFLICKNFLQFFHSREGEIPAAGSGKP